MHIHILYILFLFVIMLLTIICIVFHLIVMCKSFDNIKFYYLTFLRLIGYAMFLAKFFLHSMWECVINRRRTSNWFKIFRQTLTNEKENWEDHIIIFFLIKCAVKFLNSISWIFRSLTFKTFNIDFKIFLKNSLLMNSFSASKRFRRRFRLLFVFYD